MNNLREILEWYDKYFHSADAPQLDEIVKALKEAIEVIKCFKKNYEAICLSYVRLENPEPYKHHEAWQKGHHWLEKWIGEWIGDLEGK